MDNDGIKVEENKEDKKNRGTKEDIFQIVEKSLRVQVSSGQ